MFCKQCGKPIDDGQELCEDCKNAATANSANTNNTTYQAAPAQNVNTNPMAKSKIAAGLLGIFLGALGIHNFYLGYTSKAIAQLLITVLSCGILGVISEIWGLIEGILILTDSINVDANGVKLRD